MESYKNIIYNSILFWLREKETCMGTETQRGETMHEKITRKSKTEKSKSCPEFGLELHLP